MEQISFWLQLASTATKIAEGLAQAHALSPEEFAAKRAELDKRDSELVSSAKAALAAMFGKTP